MAISLINYFASRRRKRTTTEQRLRIQSSPAAAEEQKSVFFLALNKKLGRYCYKFDPLRRINHHNDNDNKKKGRRTRKRKTCFCSNSQQQQQQLLFNRRTRMRVLNPIGSGGGLRGGFRFKKFSTYVALGSTLYCLGGAHGRDLDAVHTVLSFDTSYPESGWKMGPPMIKPRIEPLATAIDGKLYVFGGLRHQISVNTWWGEVFDPTQDKWELLPETPVQLEDSVFAALVEEKTVVMCSKRGELYGYNVLTNGWYLLFADQTFRTKNLFKRDVSGPAAAVVEKTIYWYSYTSSTKEHKIEAYDLEKKMWFTGLLRALDWDGLVTPPRASSYDVHYCRPKLLHVGAAAAAGGGEQDDDLLWYMVWQDYRTYNDYSKNSSYNCIDFIKFRSAKRVNNNSTWGDEGVLDIQIESSRMHLIHPSLFYENAFLM